jgi:hypothetical protein
MWTSRKDKHAVAASAESFDNCQSSSPCRPSPFSSCPHLILCGGKEVGEWYRGGPGANSFSFLSFREQLFYFSILKEGNYTMAYAFVKNNGTISFVRSKVKENVLISGEKPEVASGCRS